MSDNHNKNEYIWVYDEYNMQPVSGNLPDEWEITTDPSAIWIRYKGEVLVFDIEDGMVKVEDNQPPVPLDEFIRRTEKLIGKISS